MKSHKSKDRIQLGESRVENPKEAVMAQEPSIHSDRSYCISKEHHN
jgi:hypothetical protein